MLCTVDWYLLDKYYNISQRDHLLNILKNTTQKITSEGEWISTTGYLDNYRVTVFNNKVYFNGSLNKYANQTNILPFEKAQILTSIKELQQVTRLPIHKGEILRIDIATNICLKYKYKDYLPYLEETNGYLKGKNEYGGVKYGKGNIELVFYDKLAELRKRSPETYPLIKEILSSNNEQGIMRVELRLKQRVKDQLLPEIESGGLTVVHLLSQTLQLRLIRLYYRHYNAITKTNIIDLPPSISGIKEIKTVLATMHIQFLGLSKVLTYIDGIAKQNQWSASKKSTTKKEMRELYNLNIAKTSPHYIRELNRKVMNDEYMRKWARDWMVGLIGKF